MELTDQRANISVTVKNLENVSEAREFEILHHIFCLWDHCTSDMINLPQMPDFYPTSQPHARPWAICFFRKPDISVTVVLQKEQK